MSWAVASGLGALVVAIGMRLRPRQLLEPARTTGAPSIGPTLVRGRLGLRLVGATLVVAATYGGLGVGGVVVLLLAGAAAPPALRARHRRRTARQAREAMPDLMELFVVAASAGMPVAAALGAVAERSPVVLRGAVAAARDRFERGLSLEESLDRLADDLGPGAEPLVAAMVESVASGSPLLDRLGAVADRARDGRRQRALESARRLPVTMLFPLVGCILPAAVVLAVVPVVLVSFSAVAS